MRRTHLLAGVAAAAALSLTSAGAAQASSIVFTRGGDIFLTTPDGSREHRVTSGGNYEDVTQADDGTIFAMSGGILHKLDRDGNQLAPPAGTSQLWDLDVSPDGSKIVGWYGTSSGGYPDVVSANGGTSLGWQNQPGTNPQWINNDLALMSDQGWVLTYAAGEPSTSEWFNDNGENLWRKYSPAITRAGDRLAVVVRDDLDLNQSTPPGPFQVAHYSNTSTPPRNSLDKAPESQQPTLRCVETVGDAEPSHPRFSPDGSAIAWEYPDGVRVKPVYDLASCSQPAGGFTIAGAKSPDWGPADVPAAALQFEGAVPKQKLGKALKKGYRVKVSCSAACTVRKATLKHKRKVVAKGAKSFPSGNGTLVLKFTAAGKKRLKRVKKAKVVIDIAVRDQQNRAYTATASATLRR